MTRKLLAIVALALIAASCAPGTLPPIPAPRSRDELERFPSKSDDPLDLDIAIRNGKLGEVRRLLEAGANPNARWGDRGDHHPLQEATDAYSVPPGTDRVEIVRLLLAHGADPNLRWCPFESRGSDSGWITCRSAEGATPLMAAAASDLPEIVELLLAAGADPTPKDWFGASALDHASGEITFELIARQLFPRMSTRNQDALASLERYSGGGPATPGSATPLSRAISGSGMSWSPPPPPPYQDGVISRWSYQRRTTGRVRLLLNIGADPNQRVTPDWVDWTPLALALTRDGSWTTRVLLKGGADPNARWCFSLGWYSTTKEPRTKDPACNHTNGITPLMQAASSGRADLVRELLDHGADRTLTNWRGELATDLALTDEIAALVENTHK